MNPKEFGWKEDQQITVTNPTKSDFKFQVHSKSYAVKAGQTAKMPGYIAWMYVYKLATQMAQDNKDFMHWNEEGFRQRYYDKIVVGADDVIQTLEPEPQVEAVETFDEPVDVPPSDNPTNIKPMTKVKDGRSTKS